MNEKNNPSSILIGIAIGAALSYLFTTENGKKIKKELITEGGKLLDKIGDTLEEAEKQSKTVKKITEKAEEVKEIVEEAKEAVIAEVSGAQDVVQEAIREVPAQVEQIQKKGRHFFFKKHSGSES